MATRDKWFNCTKLQSCPLRRKKGLAVGGRESGTRETGGLLVVGQRVAGLPG